MPSRYHQEIAGALKPYADKTQAVFRKRYMNTELDVLGLTVPQQRLVAKQSFSFVRGTERDILRVWDHVWRETNVCEIRSQALLYYGGRKKTLDLAHWRVLKTWVDQVDNWAHSDSLADLFSHWHEAHPRSIYTVYEKWIKARHPWKRRAALTGLFYYAAMRRAYPSYENVVALLRQALDDNNVYVQKAVGWTLRECYNVYPSKTYAQLKRWAPLLDPAAWYAANEKLSAAKKRELKALRVKGKALKK
jgi:3-methyladenine DNA glycosylase AlkD